jgi:hypothetical protein
MTRTPAAGLRLLRKPDCQWLYNQLLCTQEALPELQQLLARVLPSLQSANHQCKSPSILLLGHLVTARRKTQVSTLRSLQHYATRAARGSRWIEAHTPGSGCLTVLHTQLCGCRSIRQGR